MSSVLTDQDRRAYQANIWKAYVFRLLYLLHFYGPVFVIYLRDMRGLSLTDVTILDSLFFISNMLSEVPTGAVADRFGRKVSMALGAALWSASLLVIGLADALPVLVVAFLAWGTATSLVSGADQAILYDSAKELGIEGQFERLSGRVSAIASAAILIALLAGAPIAGTTNLAVPFLVTSGVSLLAVPVALSMHEPRHSYGDGEPYLQLLRLGLGELRRQPAVALAILYGALLWAAAYVPPFFMQPYLERHGVDVGNFGWWQAPVRVGGIVAALVAYRIVRALGRRATFIAMPLALAIAYLALAGIDHLWVFALFLVPSIVEGVQMPAVAAYLNERIESARRATVLSVQGVVSGPITAALLIGAGALADGQGLRALFLASAVMTAVAFALVVSIWLRVDAVRATSDERPATTG